LRNLRCVILILPTLSTVLCPADRSVPQQAFVITHPDQARSLLVAHPQLAYALFQALLLNKIVDPAILQVSRV
jgi:cleavage stimulation factor subunit 2